MMLIQRESMFTGEINQMMLNITPEELYAWKTGTVIQEAMPRLNADEREFVMTGITPEEWNFHLGEEE